MPSTEKDIAERLRAILQTRLSPDYAAFAGKSILYKIEVDAFGDIKPTNTKGALRGKYAFQTDLLIERKAPSVPLVVAELKFGSFSSHDVITYSAKAAQHKNVYPYLRYGFIVVGSDGLGRRFLTHNQSFDFALALPRLVGHEDEFANLMRRQIASAEAIRGLLEKERVNFRRYEHAIAIER